MLKYLSFDDYSFSIKDGFDFSSSYMKQLNVPISECKCNEYVIVNILSKSEDWSINNRVLLIYDCCFNC